MPILSTFYESIRAAVVAAWPETAAIGVYETEDIETIPWETLPVNYAGIVASNATKFEAGAAQIAFTVAVQLLYMGEVGEAGQREALRQKLDDMLSYLLSHMLSFGQVYSYDGMDWGKEIEANTVLAAKNHAHRLVRFSCTILIGYS